MDYEKADIKAVFTATAGLVSYLLNSFSELLIILVVMMVIDYITGIINAGYKGEISSRTGVKGIVKKVCYMAVVLIGYFMDYIIVYIADNLHIFEVSGPVFGFGSIVTLWLIATEGISILENFHGLGVSFPKFMLKWFKQMRKGADSAGGSALNKKK